MAILLFQINVIFNVAGMFFKPIVLAVFSPSGYTLLSVLALILITLVFLYNRYQTLKKANFKLQEKNKEILAANAKLSELNQRIRDKNSVVSEENSKLEELNKIKNRLFSIVSHDVRGPVKSIQGMLDLLQSNSIDQKELKDLVVKLNLHMSSISSFLENLLSWADSQMAANSTPNFKELDIKELINENIDLMSFVAEQKSIVVNNKLVTSILCNADKDMISLVIRNLLNNAIKFTPVGGEINLGAQLINGKATIYVEDNGVGIADDKLDKIFKLKYVTTEGTMKERGNGLGLMLCKDFVHKNLGEIGVESKLGEGSKFYFTLPLKREMEVA